MVFGKAAGFPPALELSALDGSNGFQINGEAANDWSGARLPAPAISTVMVSPISSSEFLEPIPTATEVALRT